MGNLSASCLSRAEELLNPPFQAGVEPTTLLLPKQSAWDAMDQSDVQILTDTSSDGCTALLSILGDHLVTGYHRMQLAQLSARADAVAGIPFRTEGGELIQGSLSDAGSFVFSTG